MAVDRCVCHEVSLARLQRMARERGLDYDGLSRATGCGTGCGLCEPYVRVMLRTGRTCFEVLPAAEAARIVREARSSAADAGAPTA